MIQKEERFIITFHTTAEAIAMEKACAKEGLPGRLIPVPRQLSSGCGLSFSAPVKEQERMIRFLDGNGLCYEATGVFWI